VVAYLVIGWWRNLKTDSSLYKPYLQKALQQELDRYSRGASSDNGDSGYNADMSSDRNKDKKTSPKSSLHIHEVDVVMDGLWMVMNAANGYQLVSESASFPTYLKVLLFGSVVIK